ncbi:MAG: metallophosphoesterase [Coprobacillus sp.]
MKKIVIMSDNHGQDMMLQRVRDAEKNVDYYIHCGDSEASYKELLSGYICVKGNNDWALELPMDAKIVVEGHNILITHGHRFGYFNREYAMHDALTRNKCDILISGHTHMPMFIKEGQYTFINPGSTSLPRGGSSKSYAVVYVDGENITCEFKEIK